MTKQFQGAIIDSAGLPEQYPTHAHDPEFWEHLGRAVASFGFLEEVLGKAIFAHTATQRIEESEIEDALKKWLPTLKIALTGALGSLIGKYETAIKANPNSTFEELDDLIADLRKASKLRNVLCHGSWQLPDKEGGSIPFFISQNMERFETSVDIPFLRQVRRHVVELACTVINTVTHMGLQFPGSTSPGKPIE